MDVWAVCVGLKTGHCLTGKEDQPGWHFGQVKMGVAPSMKQQAELFSMKVLKYADATLMVYQGKPRKNICILSIVHTGVGTFSGAKTKQSMQQLAEELRAECMEEKSGREVGSSGTNHRSSSRHRTGGSAGPKELQTE